MRIYINDLYDGFTVQILDDGVLDKTYVWDHNDPNPGLVVKQLFDDLGYRVEYEDLA